MKTSNCYLLAVFLLGCLVAQGYSIRCDCDNTACRSRSDADQCCNWTPQPIDTDLASLSDPNGTPNGFLQDEVPGGDTLGIPPCVTFTFPTDVNDSSRPYFLSVVATTPSGISICIAANEEVENADEPACAQNVVRFCDMYANEASVDIYFDCENRCADQANNPVIYYRGFFNLSVPVSAQEDFCTNFPPTLPVPNDIIPPPPPGTVDVNIPTRAPGGAAHLASLCSPLLLLLALIAKSLTMS